MKPTTFPQAFKTLTPPNGIKKCGDLPVFTDGNNVVSCWKPSLWERIRIVFGGKVFLGVLSGNTQPPVWMTTENPFEASKPATKAALLWYDIKDAITDTASLIRYNFTQADKRKHFIVGMVIAWLFGFVWHLCGLPLPCVFGFLVGAMAGIVKEWWDSKGHGTVEVMEFVFTAMGALVSMGLTFICKIIF